MVWQIPWLKLEPQFYASAQASANLAIGVSPNAKIGISVGPSVLGKGNLVDAQILAFVNGTVEVTAQAQNGRTGAGSPGGLSKLITPPPRKKVTRYPTKGPLAHWIKKQVSLAVWWPPGASRQICRPDLGMFFEHRSLIKA